MGIEGRLLEGTCTGNCEEERNRMVGCFAGTKVCPLFVVRGMVGCLREKIREHGWLLLSSEDNLFVSAFILSTLRMTQTLHSQKVFGVVESKFRDNREHFFFATLGILVLHPLVWALLKLKLNLK
ncbi:hypothetical protein ACFE04_019457 [Oxalis oulophora]